MKLEDSQLTGRERHFLLNSQRREPPNRGRYAEAVDETTKELDSMGAMMHIRTCTDNRVLIMCLYASSVLELNLLNTVRYLSLIHI